MGGWWEQLVNLIIRPARRVYSVSQLGSNEFFIDSRLYERTDVELRNSRGLTLQCSHFEPSRSIRKTVGDQLPCVVYCHGNSGCRLDGFEAVRALLPVNMTVFTFDFSGSGLSDGEYVSLGHFEQDDLEVVVQYLRSLDSVSTIGLWGRSMGAVTSILHASRDPSIAGMVLDSPFSDLYELMVDIVKSRKSWIPRFAIWVAVRFLRKSVLKRAQFDINMLKPIDFVSQCFIPALFAHASGDDFISPRHSSDLFSKYAGDKNIISFEGDHNSYRPEFFYSSASTFFYNCLVAPSLCMRKGDSSIPTSLSSPSSPILSPTFSDEHTIPSYSPMEGTGRLADMLAFAGVDFSDNEGEDDMQISNLNLDEGSSDIFSLSVSESERCDSNILDHPSQSPKDDEGFASESLQSSSQAHDEGWESWPMDALMHRLTWTEEDKSDIAGNRPDGMTDEQWNEFMLRKAIALSLHEVVSPVQVKTKSISLQDPR